MKKSTLIRLGIYIVLFFLILSSANAYDPTYFRPIRINNTGGSELTYYPVVLNVTYSTGMQTDFDDLRIGYYNGVEWVYDTPYWIEKKVNNEWCKLWFNATSIPANSWCNDTYRLYYGDNLANSESSISDTFIREIDGLNASWHFDEGEENTAYDSSGNDNDGTIYGANWTDGKFGKALSYDGSNDYVNCGNDESLNITDGITIEVWIEVDQVDPISGLGQHIIRKEGAWAFGIGPSGRIGWWLSNATCWVGSWSFSSTTINANNLHHIIGIRDDDTMKVYIDNTQDQNTQTITGSLSVNSNNVVIGKFNESIDYEQFKGIIDELRIYERALSEDEISDLYNYYGYTTTNYPGKVLVRKRIDPEPTVSLGSEITLYTTPSISSVAVSDITESSAVISWQTNQSTDNRVKYSKYPDLSSPSWSSWDNDTTSVSITLTGLEPDTTYYYQAWSYNGTNSSCYTVEPPFSPYESFTTLQPSPFQIVHHVGVTWIEWRWTGINSSSVGVMIDGVLVTNTTVDHYILSDLHPSERHTIDLVYNGTVVASDAASTVPSPTPYYMLFAFLLLCFLLAFFIRVEHFSAFFSLLAAILGIFIFKTMLFYKNTGLAIVSLMLGVLSVIWLILAVISSIVKSRQEEEDWI